MANDLISLAYFTSGSTTVAVNWVAVTGSATVTVPPYQYLLNVEVGDEVRLTVFRRTAVHQQTVYGWYALIYLPGAMSSEMVFFGDTETSGYGNRDLGVRLDGDSAAVAGDIVIKSSFVDLAVFPAASP